MTNKDVANQASKDVGEQSDKSRQKVFDEAGATVTRIAEELVLVGFSKITDFLEVDNYGRVKIKSLDLKNGKARKLAAIKKLKQTELLGGIRTEIELHDKLGALHEILMQRGDAPGQKVDVNQSGTITIRIKGRHNATE